MSQPAVTSLAGTDHRAAFAAREAIAKQRMADFTTIKHRKVIGWESFKRIYPNIPLLDHREIRWNGTSSHLANRPWAKKVIAELALQESCGFWINLKKDGSRVVVVPTCL